MGAIVAIPAAGSFEAIEHGLELIELLLLQERIDLRIGRVGLDFEIAPLRGLGLIGGGGLGRCARQQTSKSNQHKQPEPNHNATSANECANPDYPVN